MKTAVLLILSTAAAIALDLTPQQTFKELETQRIPVLAFKHGNRKAQWMPPAEWRMLSEGQRLAFFVKGLTHAGMELRVVPRTAGDSEALQTDEMLVKYASAFFPRTATEVKVTGKNPGPYTINGIAAQEFLVEFREPTHPTMASFSVVDLNAQERLIVVISAQPKDFDGVRSTALESLNTWQIL